MQWDVCPGYQHSFGLVRHEVGLTPIGGGWSREVMGDVLTGIIAALLAQGLTLEDAAAVGVTVHAKAGDLAAAAGERGLIASDLLDKLRAVINP